MLDTKHKVLIVDDVRPIASTLSNLFRLHNYETAVAHSGEEAIEVARSFRPDFLLTDVVMGAMNGIDAAIEILSLVPDCRVLLMSGFVPTEVLNTARLRGYSFELVQKPIGPNELLTKVSQILEPNRSS